MFDIVFAQLVVIPKIRNKFVEIVAESYFIIAQVKIFKEAASLIMPSCKISWRKNFSKKTRKICSCQNYSIFSLG